jgi:hypothetical protein
MFGGETLSALDRCNNLFFRRATLVQSIPGMGMQSDFHGSSVLNEINQPDYSSTSIHRGLGLV